MSAVSYLPQRDSSSIFPLVPFLLDISKEDKSGNVYRRKIIKVGIVLLICAFDSSDPSVGLLTVYISDRWYISSFLASFLALNLSPQTDVRLSVVSSCNMGSSDLVGSTTVLGL